MARRGYGVLLLNVDVLLLLLFPSLLQAETQTGIVDMLPRHSDRDRVSSILAKKMRVESVLVPVDTAMIEALRWSVPDPVRFSCESDAPRVIEQIKAVGRVTPPPSAGELFSTLLKQTEEQFLYVDFEGALASLEAARTMLPCARTPLSRADVRAFFLYQAVAHVHLKDNLHQEAFLHMLAADPRVYLEPDHPPRVQAAFLEAAKAFMRFQPMKLQADALGGEVFFDGEPVANVPEVRAGQHILQLKGPNGEYRTRLITVTEGQTPLVLSALVDFGLPPDAALKEELARSLLAETLDEVQKKGLEAYLAATNRQEILFALALPQQGGLTVAVYEAGIGLLASDSERAGELFRKQPPWPEARGSEGRRTAEEDIEVGPEQASGDTDGGGPDGSGPDGSGPGLGIVAQIQAGFGRNLMAEASASQGPVLDITGYKQLGTRFLVGFFARFSYESLAVGSSYPRLTYGALGAMRFPLGAHLAFVPALGYAFGKGPATEAECSLEPDGSSESFVCTPEETGAGTTGSYSALLATRNHGPLVRLEFAYRGRLGAAEWAAGLGINGQYAFMAFKEGELSVDGQPIPYTLSSADGSSTLRLDILAGFSVLF